MSLSDVEKNAIIRRVIAELGTAGGSEARLAPLLFERPPSEDLKALPTAALAAAVRTAALALAAHRPGEPVVRVEQPDGFTAADGGPLQLIDVVNDDGPFLFDSVMAEIADTTTAIRYISHPILDIARDVGGSVADFGARSPGDANANSGDGGRVSLIQVAIAPLGDGEAAEALAERIRLVLRHVHDATADFAAMRQRVGEAGNAMRKRAAAAGSAEQRDLIEEAARLLEWLHDDNFIFLGCREYDLVGNAGDEALERREAGGLGILGDPNVPVLRRAGRPVSMTPEILAFLRAGDPLIVTKANTRSLVHRRGYMDYVGVKEYDEAGELKGELRIVGLFTSTAYTRSILTIPYLRLKAERVIARFGLRPGSHSAKALLNTLEAYPRDDLFQIDAERLEDVAATIMELGERPRIRVLPRVDRFDRFVSVLVFVPRDRYDSRLRERIGLLLAQRYDGHVSAYYPAFPEGMLARVHFIIGRSEGATPTVDPADLERAIIDLARIWEDDFVDAVAAAGHPRALTAIAPGMPESYRDVVPPAEAVLDAARIGELADTQPLEVDFYRREGDAEELVRLKIYHLGQAVALSTRVPILENMGFRVVSERTFAILRPGGETVHLHDMDLTRARGGVIALGDTGRELEATFTAVWAGRIENDGFNALVLEAGLGFRQANVLRAYARYLRQAGLGYSQDYLSDALLRYPDIAAALWELFATAFDPDAERASPSPERAATAEPGAGPSAVEAPDAALAARAAARGGSAILERVLARLDSVDSLDDDRILRRFLGTVLATLRTNYFAVDGISADPAAAPGAVAPALAFKLDSAAVEGLPQPVPFREIFVFDARVEGIHLRFGKVARGGLRWSDRAQDYRTEVLGLVKAQQVKNAVIVPVGAKGGFYPKRLPDASAREAWFEAGRAAYVIFVDSLLSVTDTIDGDAVVPPQKVVRYDGDDPYFVVAADKGTATFSDTANAIAQSRGFWLDDAFASGGSAGYDHKAMGITARGAWEAVKRHFRELGRDGGAWDIQAEPFTVAGCGDMSGDVFGNGMLLSKTTKLLAAFDHRDIFIDPDPEPEAAFAERRRLFDKPRSSWADYDKALISRGGGVWSRRDKQIRLSDEAAAAIGWDKRTGTPAEVIAAILRAPVDLLWFGGIGTYIRAASETNADVGDRANDAVRITGAEIRARVVGEGANLGVTQKGRIEYAAKGGRINSDAIDNSAGVNTSDVEVNIKIALKSAMAEGRLERPARNRLLASMTDEVAALVLANNYHQTLAISLEQARGAAALPLQARFMAVLEEAGRLDRQVEMLPGDGALADLKSRGRGLTRPEIAVLLAYAKIVLFDQLVDSSLPDDPYLQARLSHYFPAPMRERFAGDIAAHRLAREIVATDLANAAVNRLGLTFILEVREATGGSPAEVVRGFVAAYDALGAEALYRSVDALDGTIAGGTQNALYGEIGETLRLVTRWFVQNEAFPNGLAPVVEAVAACVAQLESRLSELASDRAREEAASRETRWTDLGVPADIAATIARLPLLALVPDIAAVSRETGEALDTTVSAYFALTRLFRIGRLETALRDQQPNDYYETLALERAGSQISAARRRITAAVLRQHGSATEPVSAWADERRSAVDRITGQMASLAGSGETSVARLTMAAGLLSDLAV
ncbi:NAD-glutamate dehydrogenase [Mangrovicella endophytica]|uniref:NAD-glutamate dehydrogenase n=1 Tax=Mangrovicella endophytica TaxID=2066697 RepID=UPI000C9EAFD7|nr:NAD-glutamate dehydrogenase [Mangrovicella endophytica]